VRFRKANGIRDGDQTLKLWWLVGNISSFRAKRFEGKFVMNTINYC
jgi:hypothetical protein